MFFLEFIRTVVRRQLLDNSLPPDIRNFWNYTLEFFHASIIVCIPSIKFLAVPVESSSRTGHRVWIVETTRCSLVPLQKSRLQRQSRKYWKWDERAKGGKTGERFILSGGRVKISVKREIGVGEERTGEPGVPRPVPHPFNGRRVCTHLPCSPWGWVMCSVHTINLICRVERLSELNQGRWLDGRTGTEFYSFPAYVDRRHRLYARPRSFMVLTPRIVRYVMRFRFVPCRLSTNASI